VSSGDSEQRKRWTFRVTPTLLPVPQSVDADAKCIGERPLGHPQEAPQRHNIVTALKLTTSDALAQLVRNRAVEIALC
jgi:hypothetical protein